uniref:ATP synthase subunit a n=1 Tax=Oryza coarctata TaxID=77588 RepID=A0A2I8BIH3_ORYCO|nr:ATP synthase F0 subunit 6 [Oryza coarctata]AUT20002.1 ATP synthase F0 subunit 6 [Oryza coarctata]
MDMKDRRNKVFSTTLPTRSLTIPLQPVVQPADESGIFVLLRIDSYLYQTGRRASSPEALSDFRYALLRPLWENGETFSDILAEINANGIPGGRFASRIDVLWPQPTTTNGSSTSPLDQFFIDPLFGLDMGNFYLSFTNESLSMCLPVVLVPSLFGVVTKKGGGKSVPNAWQSLVELIYDFVLNLVNEQIGGLSGNVKQKFFPRISVTFTFSLFRNPQGMIPFSFTVTSHFLITLALSFSIFIGITIVGFQRHGLHFFSFLLPAGVPLPLAPFLVLLELISHCFRALSSGIRLFANMMAGHSSVKILSGFAWTMLFLNNIFYFIGDLGPLFIVLALTGLELGVAISQAHVSTISICIYLNDATNLHQNE